MMFGSLGVGAVHGTLSIASAMQDGTIAVEEDRQRHESRRQRGLE